MSTKEKEQKKEKQKRKVVGWFTEKMEEKESKQEFGDAEDMVQRRTIFTTVGPLVPYKSCVSHFMYCCRTCVDSTIWYFVLFVSHW